MKCIICHQVIDNLQHYVANHHIGDNLRSYLNTLQKPIIRRKFKCGKCKQEFTDNRRYLAHLAMRDYYGENDTLSSIGGETVTRDHFASYHTLSVVIKPNNEEPTLIAFLDRVHCRFVRHIRALMERYTASGVTFHVEFTHIFKLILINGEEEMGLPEKQVSRTVSCTRIDVEQKMDAVMLSAKTRVNNNGSERSGSRWILDKYVFIKLSAVVNALQESGFVRNLVGGKGHGNPFILSEAIDDDNDSDSDNNDIDINNDADEEFIDDSEIVDNTLLGCEPPSFKTLEIDDYVPRDDECMGDIIEDDNSEKGKNLSEINATVGVNLTEGDMAFMNKQIDKGIIESGPNTDGNCTFISILNGIAYTKFKVKQSITEEKFKRVFPDIYSDIISFKKALRYAPLNNVINIVMDINDILISKYNIGLNIYERKERKYLLDIITTEKKANRYILSMVKVLYRHSVLSLKKIDEVHLLIQKQDGTLILDMCTLTDMSMMVREIKVVPQGNRRMRLLYVCDRCYVAFANKRPKDKHYLYCNGLDREAFLFHEASIKTYENHIRNIVPHPCTVYYDLETASSETDMQIISYSYVCIFMPSLKIPPMIVYRSIIDTEKELCKWIIPLELGEVSFDDRLKLEKCRKDILQKEPHCMTQMMTMELSALQSLVHSMLKKKELKHGVLNNRSIISAMENYETKNCALCGFTLDDSAIIPFKETVMFTLRKIYMTQYCSITDHKTNKEGDDSEIFFVQTWMRALETIAANELYTKEEKK